jgi:copper chaperone CopZ
MAAHKRTHARKRRTSFLRFPEVKGKIVESVEIDPAVQAITIVFQDKTALSFDLEPSLTVFPELSVSKTGNWRGIKRWPAVRSKLSIISWT